ncbi:MAG: hypothetical protein Q9195_009048 [Heterodermia aff. obscurata]
MSLEGYVLIFGAGSGIGRETGYTFAERGATGICFADLNEKAAQDAADASQKLATKDGYQVIAMHVDVTDRNSVRKVVAATLKEFGRIDFNINSAGVSSNLEAPVTEIPIEEFDRVHNVNARGMLFCIAEVAKVMQAQDEKFTRGRSGRRSIGRGSIVTLSSLNGQIPVSSHVQYGSSKYAALGITHTAAVELARKGVRVNCLLPSWVDTPMMDKEIARQTDLLAAIQSLTPLGRMANVEEVAEAIHFLCSPGASYINGIGLVIDSGFSLTRGLA